MGLRFSKQIYGNCFFVTTTFNNWKKYGNIPGFYEKLAESLNFTSQKYKAGIIAYVFMPSHIHLIVAIEGVQLSNFMRDFKKYISQKAAKDLGIQDKTIWMKRYDNVVIFSEDVLKIKLNYLHNNPVKDNLVQNPEDWKWSSYNYYYNDIVGSVGIKYDFNQVPGHNSPRRIKTQHNTLD